MVQLSSVDVVLTSSETATVTEYGLAAAAPASPVGGDSLLDVFVALSLDIGS